MLSETGQKTVPEVVPFSTAPRLLEYADKKAARMLDRLFVKHYPLPLVTLPHFLDLHQFHGVRWALSRSRSYLAHAPGAGKTLQALVVSILSPSHHSQTLFVVPPSLTANWEREIHYWGPMVDWSARIFTAKRGVVAVIPESKDQKEMNWNADFLICPDSMLAKDWVLENLLKLKFRVVAIDEASRFKEATSERTKAAFGGTLKSGSISTGLIYNADHAILLDGSPMPNRPMELWAPTFAMAPEAIDFMTEMNFGLRYCGAHQGYLGRWEFRGATRLEELREKLQKDFMHVVTEEELEHPERLRSLLLMSGKDPRSAEQRKWEKENLSKIKFNDLSEESSLGQLASYRREIGIKKVKWAAEYIADRLRTKNESILVFAWHREVVEELARLLENFSPGVILGGTWETHRESAFEAFQKGRSRLIIGNIAAMGRGHNLQKADRVIFVEYSWTDENNKQCEKRASRKGRDKDLPVRCDYLVLPDSLDHLVLNAVFRKAELTKRVIG